MATEKLRHPYLNDDGSENLDPTPMVIHIRGRRIDDYDRVREFIRMELSAQAAGQGGESFEEANDFEVDGDLFPVSPHEYSEDTEASDREAIVNHHRTLRDKKKAAKAAAPDSDGEDEGPRESLPSKPKKSAAKPSATPDDPVDTP